MEDFYTIVKDFDLKSQKDRGTGAYLAVFDGHASKRGSEHAVRHLHEILASQLELAGGGGVDPAAVESSLTSAFEEEDGEIIQEEERLGKAYGTTAVCALILGRELWVSHVGDSRAVFGRGLAGGRGEAVALTKDHKPATNLKERARIEALGGKISYASDRIHSNPEASKQLRLNMSRALGDSSHKEPRRLVVAEPDIVHVQLDPGTDRFIVLGSDGLFDVMCEHDVGSIVNRSLGSEPSKGWSDEAASVAAQALVAEALRRGTSDNVTALVALFG